MLCARVPLFVCSSASSKLQASVKSENRDLNNSTTPLYFGRSAFSGNDRSRRMVGFSSRLRFRSDLRDHLRWNLMLFAAPRATAATPFRLGAAVCPVNEFVLFVPRLLFCLTCVHLVVAMDYFIFPTVPGTVPGTVPET